MSDVDPFIIAPELTRLSRAADQRTAAMAAAADVAAQEAREDIAATRAEDAVRARLSDPVAAPFYIAQHVIDNERNPR